MTLREQFLSLALMILMGIWIGASFSVYQRFVHPGKRMRWILLLTDPLFWILQALLLFILLLPVNEGRLRFYMFLGTALGFSFYKVLLEKPFLLVFDKIVRLIVQICSFIAKTIYQLVLYPLYFLLMLVFKLCKMIVSVVFKIIGFILIFPLKLLRGFLRLILPERWLIGFKNQILQFHQWFLRGIGRLSKFWPRK
ncbi:MAG: spore cortex biosynthesis protein YabQ [Sporolactobacillus sp.]